MGVIAGPRNFCAGAASVQEYGQRTTSSSVAAPTNQERTMDESWRVDVNEDVSVSTDGTRCVIGGVVSVAFTLDEVELVWTEQPEGVIDPRGLLKLQLKDRPGTLAAIRLKRGEAEQVRTILEARGSYLH
ncbi:MAG: hypothetical protein ACOYLX_08060 [Burkholderiaceae bacterium]|jgi:hypothetical protein